LLPDLWGRDSKIISAVKKEDQIKVNKANRVELILSSDRCKTHCYKIDLEKQALSFPLAEFIKKY